MDGTEAAALGRADGAVCAEWWDGKRVGEALSPRTMQIYLTEGAVSRRSTRASWLDLHASAAVLRSASRPHAWCRLDGLVEVGWCLFGFDVGRSSRLR
jgi:hypothetical protein